MNTLIHIRICVIESDLMILGGAELVYRWRDFLTERLKIESEFFDYRNEVAKWN